MKKLHTPVLLEQSIDALNIKSNGIYLDCTFGRGGHTIEILKKLSNKGKLICFDRDQEAINFFKNNIKKSNCLIFHSKFSEIKKILLENGINEVDGILYDLGLSSPQIDNKKRGFSYLENYRLDMRMDQRQEMDANFILKNYTYEQLFKIFKNNANDNNPKRICQKIIEFREDNLDKDFFSEDLSRLIREGIDKKKLYLKKFPETKYFQAIRIEVNDEINEIITSLESAFKILKNKGRIVVITFNSLEDKIVKNIFFEKTKILIPKEIPITNNLQNFKIINKKYSYDDQKENNRSKSSKIRCVERC